VLINPYFPPASDEGRYQWIKVGRDHARYLQVLDRVGGEILVCEPNEGTWLENMRDHGQRVTSRRVTSNGHRPATT
jgi:hypothetical protein